MTTPLADQIVGLHTHLVSAGLDHAFGGALALAYCTSEPRATKDIDVNVFIGIDRIDDLFAALPADVAVTERNRTQLTDDAQSRLFWETTPIDVFLNNHPFHEHAEANRRTVPFADVADLPVLACADLAVFKAFFARPKDGVDITAMVQAGAVDLDNLERVVATLLGNDDERRVFFDRIRGDLEAGRR
jgi:hypothetical protein